MKSFLKKFFVAFMVVLFFMTLPLMDMKARAEDKKESFEVRISSGVEGKFRALKYIPITVEFTSNEKDFKGEVEIRITGDSTGSYDAYSKEVSASQGEANKVVIPIKMSEGSSKISVNFVENGKVLYEKKGLVSSGRVSEANLLLGVLTDDQTGLSYIGSTSFELNPDQKGGIEKVKLDENIIGENNLNIDGLDVIIINNYNMANLKDEHYTTLNSWINRGGLLIIGAGANEGKTINNINKDFLNIKSSGVKEQNIKVVDDNLNLITSSLSASEGKVKFGSKENPLAYSFSRGKGEIIVSAFDLGIEPLISSKDASKFLSTLLVSKISELYNKNYFGGFYQNTYRIQEISSNIPINNIVGTTPLIVVLAIYAIVIGIALYIILKKLNKRDLTWIMVPAISIIFAIVIYFMGSSTRVNDIILNQNSIIKVDKNGKGTAKGYLGIGTKYKDDVKIEKPEDLTMNYLINDNYYYGGQEEKISNKLRVKTTYNGNNSYFTFEDSDALDMKSFEIIGKEQVLPTIESSFNINEGNLVGKVKNTIGYDIEKLLLVTGTSVWDLGNIEKDEEKDISSKAIASSYGLQPYSDTLSQNYYNARWNNKDSLKSKEYKNILRNATMIGVAAEELSSDKDVKLIAITNMPMDYNVDFEGKSISKFDTTVIIQDAEIDFKDKDGNYNFPEGYFNPELDGTSTNVGVDEYNGYIYGSGEIVFRFDIPTNIEIVDLKIKQGVDRNGIGSSNTSEKYIYNYSTDSYERIYLGQGYEKLKNVSDHVENNSIKIKYVVDDLKGQETLPRISVKGREK
ncbi:hypothetical protein [Clostridium sp.]|uniref:hypothetical protein n=1 Tax=Clostridium sp. TaxID=1506 RepID=UPI001DCBF1B5|nr:hypothetical protein [Clostridium sp.]MBS5939654.1 hypothetical protein [Clostridium sp.]